MSHTEGVNIDDLSDSTPLGSLEVRFSLPVRVSRYQSLFTHLFSSNQLDIQFQFSTDGRTWGKDFAGTGDFFLSALNPTITSRETGGEWMRIVVTNQFAVAGTSFTSRTFGSFCDVGIPGAAGNRGITGASGATNSNNNCQFFFENLPAPQTVTINLVNVFEVINLALTENSAVPAEWQTPAVGEIEYLGTNVSPKSFIVTYGLLTCPDSPGSIDVAIQPQVDTGGGFADVTANSRTDNEITTTTAYTTMNYTFRISLATNDKMRWTVANLTNANDINFGSLSISFSSGGGGVVSSIENESSANIGALGELNVGNTNLPGEITVIRNGDVIPDPIAQINAVFVGNDAGLAAGIHDTAIGYHAMQATSGVGGVTFGAQNVAVGFQAMDRSQGGGVNNVAVGWNAGSEGAGNLRDGNVAIGSRALGGTLNRALNCVAVGTNTMRRTQDHDYATVVGTFAFSIVPNLVPTEGYICLGAECALTGTVVNRSVQIGRQCAAAGAVGRLAWGNAMETPHGSFAMPNGGVPEAYIKMEWNGTLYYLPAFTTAPV